MTTDTGEATEVGSSRVSLGEVFIGILQVTGLSAIAVAQPLLDLLGRNAEFFVARGSEAIDIWLLTLFVLLVIPFATLAVELAVRQVSGSAYRIVHATIVGVLVGMIALLVLNRFLSVDGWILVGIAVVAGVACGVAYRHYRDLRSFMTWLFVAPLVIAGMFLFLTPVNRLVMPAAEANVNGVVVAGDTPVVIVVWDAMNSVSIAADGDAIDGHSYPNFARLADDGTWYRWATGVADATSLAVPAILDGMFPDADLLPIAADHPRSLFALFGENHNIFAREPVTAVCPMSTCENTTPVERRVSFGERLRSLVSDLKVVYLRILLPTDLSGWLPEIDRVWSDFGSNAANQEGGVGEIDFGNSDEIRGEFEDRRANDYIRSELASDRAASVEAFIDDLPRKSDLPPFVFLHAALPHAPYRYAPSGRQYGNSGALPGNEKGVWTGGEWATTQGEQRLLMQIGTTDHLLGKLVDWLEQSGWYDKALIIVTADHGVAFTAGGQVRNATAENFGETISVPMIVKLPFQSAGNISDDDVRTIDILPTVIDALNIDIDWEMDGRSMLADPIDRGQKALRKVDGTVIEGDPTLPAWGSALANKIRRFRNDDGVIDVYHPGNAAFVGANVSALDVAVESVGSVQVNALDGIQEEAVSSDLSPSHLTGTIRLYEATLDDIVVAVAVNHVIRVVGPPMEPDSLGGTFSYFAPEDAFEPVGNSIAFYVVQGTEESPLLVPLDLEATRLYSTSVYEDGIEYLESDGVGIPINGQLSGRIDVATLIGSVYVVGGWTADTLEGEPADEVVVVVDGVSVLVAPLNRPRPDVGIALGDPVYTGSGFGFDLAVEVVEGAESIRVFGVSRGVAATELSLPEGVFSD
jgi:hypothetical protein